MIKMFSKYREIVLGILILVVASETFVVSQGTACDDWASYKDEKCFKILDNFFGSYDEAEKNCAKLENSPTLAIVHSKEEQDFLANYLFKTLKKVDNFWIGAKSSNNASFKWIDNTDMNYSNWVKTPKNISNYCVQMQSEVDMVGKWTDEPCEKRNAAVCQKMQTWSIARLQKALLEARKEFRDAMDEANKKIAILEKNQIPIGFLYTQLPNEKPPTSIWSSMTWSDVSAAYAGVFFKVEGGGSERFGQTQTENDRRVVRVENTISDGTSVYHNYTIDANTVGQSTKNSIWIWTGDNAKERHHEVYLRLITTTGEIRPRNMAIRVWKRTG